MTDSDAISEQQRFPIGRFQRREAYTPDERASHIERLATQPSRLTAAVSGFTEHDYVAPYRPGGWTVQQLVHHVADSHLNAYVRVKLGLTEDEPTIKPYDQDAWVTLADVAVSPWSLWRCSAPRMSGWLPCSGACARTTSTARSITPRTGA